MTLAFDDERPANQQLVGAVLSGFGCAPDRKSLDYQAGVVSMLLVHPDYRQKGLGATLLQKAEQYLAEKGTHRQPVWLQLDSLPLLLGHALAASALLERRSSR